LAQNDANVSRGTFFGTSFIFAAGKRGGASNNNTYGKMDRIRVSVDLAEACFA